MNAPERGTKKGRSLLPRPSPCKSGRVVAARMSDYKQDLRDSLDKEDAREEEGLSPHLRAGHRGGGPRSRSAVALCAAFISMNGGERGRIGACAFRGRGQFREMEERTTGNEEENRGCRTRIGRPYADPSEAQVQCGRPWSSEPALFTSSSWAPSS